MKGIILIERCALVLMLFCLISVQALSADKFAEYSLSIPTLKMEETEKIEAFTATIIYGDVVSIPRIPVGWSIHSDSSPLWKTVVTASKNVDFRDVGDAALTSKETDYFKDFLVIRSNDPEYSIRVAVELTMSDKKRRVFKETDLKLELVKRKEPR